MSTQALKEITPVVFKYGIEFGGLFCLINCGVVGLISVSCGPGSTDGSHAAVTGEANFRKRRATVVTVVDRVAGSVRPVDTFRLAGTWVPSCWRSRANSTIRMAFLQARLFPLKRLGEGGR
jgi:hypothetical protein